MLWKCVWLGKHFGYSLTVPLINQYPISVYPSLCIRWSIALQCFFRNFCKSGYVFQFSLKEKKYLERSWYRLYYIKSIAEQTDDGDDDDDGNWLGMVIWYTVNMLISVRCTGAVLCWSTGLLQPPYFLMFLCSYKKQFSILGWRNIFNIHTVIREASRLSLPFSLSNCNTTWTASPRLPNAALYVKKRKFHSPVYNETSYRVMPVFLPSERVTSSQFWWHFVLCAITQSDARCKCV